MATVTVRVPTTLRHLTRGTSEVSAGGETLREVIEQLESSYPGFRDRLLGDDGALRRFMNVYVGEDDVRYEKGLDTPTPPGSTLWLIPAVAGGSRP